MLSGISVININMPEAVYNAKVLVTTAGTRVQLTSDVTGIKSGVTIKALDTNTGLIYVGDVSVTSDNGYQLAAGETSFFEVKNRALIYIDSAENLDGITYITSGAVSIVPVITSVSPIGGLPAGTNTITVSGNNFIGVSSVAIDSNPCPTFTVTSVTSLTAEVPVGTVGAKTVEVVGVGGTGTLVSGYTYEDVPTVTSITPNSGTDDGGTSVTIAGTNFVNTLFVSSVKIGGADCSTIVVVSDISITAVTPVGTAGAEDVVVTTPSGAGTLAGGFTYTTYANNYSMGFNGSSNIYTSGSWAELSTPAYSISFWAKADPATLAWSKTMFYLGDSSTNKFRLKLSVDTAAIGYFRLEEGNADSVSHSSAIKALYYFIVDDLWHHYVIASAGDGSSGSVVLYMDGLWAASFTGKALGSSLITAKLMVASRYSSGYPLACNIDEFAMFNTQLDTAAVAALYNNGIPADLTSHANITHWWRMGDGAGDTSSNINDQKGSWDLDTVNGSPSLDSNVSYIIANTVDPYYGDIAGGTTITITGSNLADVSAVSVGGNPCSSVSASAGSVTAITDSGSAGTADIIVTDSTNNSAVTLPDRFFYRTGSVPAWANESSAVFDGSNAFSTTKPWPELSTSNAGYSISLWTKINPSDVTSQDATFALNNIGGKGRFNWTIDEPSNAYWRVNESTADYDSYSTGIGSLRTMILQNKWYHVVFTSTGDGSSNGVKTYIDGTFADKFTGKDLGPSSNLPAALRLTLAGSFGAGRLICNIDEFAIFDTVLSAAAVALLYNSGIPTDITSHAGIKHYYRMGDSIGDTATLIRDQAGGWDLDYIRLTPAIATEVPHIIVTSVLPYYGDSTAGGTTITITGSNLANVSSVTVGGNLCTGLSASASSVTADTIANGGTDAVVDIVITDSTNNSTLTIANGFVYRSGSVPSWVNTYSMEFDGSNDIFTSKKWPEFNSSFTAYSVSFWAKVVTPVAQSDYLFNLVNAYDFGYDRLGMYTTNGSSGDVIFKEGNSDSVSYTSTVKQINGLLSDSLWHHYVIASPGTEGGTVTIYADGSSIGTFSGRAVGSNPVNLKLNIAAQSGVYSRMACNIDEFAIFGTELSAGDVTTLWNTGTPYDITEETGIQHYYRMGDSIGDTAAIIRDQVGNWDLDFLYGTPALDADVP